MTTQTKALRQLVHTWIIHSTKQKGSCVPVLVCLPILQKLQEFMWHNDHHPTIPSLTEPSNVTYENHWANIPTVLLTQMTSSYVDALELLRMEFVCRFFCCLFLHFSVFFFFCFRFFFSFHLHANVDNGMLRFDVIVYGKFHI